MESLPYLDPFLLSISMNTPVPMVTNSRNSTESGDDIDDAVTLEVNQPLTERVSLRSEEHITSQNEATSLSEGTCTGSGMVNYMSHTLKHLKAECKARNLRVGGGKAELARRLTENDLAVQMAAAPVITAETNHTPIPTLEIDAAQVVADSATLVAYFDTAVTGNEEEEDVSNKEEDEVDNEDEENIVNSSSTTWVDSFILETRRKGGRQTENSVLKQWKLWASEAVAAGTIPDLIVDAHHMIEYMKYAATRGLFSTRGQKKTSSSRLSSSSLKKIMTMLGRVRGRQEEEDPQIKLVRPAKTTRTEAYFKAVMVQAQRLRLEGDDFDITKGTILDSELRPHQFDEVTRSIFEMNQLPSIIKAHFAWTWQCSTLNRIDEVISMLLACLQPFTLRLPDYTDPNSNAVQSVREEFGVLAMFHETKTAQPGKTEPVYSFALPHRNPLRCPVGALAILLHYMFDQESLVSRIPEWKWEESASWRQIHVLFGRHVEQPTSGDAMGRMYATFLKETSITSSKRTHITRRTFPPILEEMGVPADQVDAVGHWKGNTRREVYGSKIPKAAAVALAGFPVGESYVVPWANLPVPEALQNQLFPFVEATEAELRVAGCKNQGTFNFLALLRRLRPFFWRSISAIRAEFPASGIAKRLGILSSPEAALYMDQWPALLQREQHVRNQSGSVEKSFHEKPTRNAFSAVATELRELRQIVDIASSDMSIIKRRTEQFSPSKKQGKKASVLLPDSELLSSLQSEPLLPLHQSPPEPEHTSPLFPHIQNTPTPPLAAPASQASPFVPQTIMHLHRTYTILPLSTAQTPHDLILPPSSAFTSSQYPVFAAQDCTWQYILSNVVNPTVLWAVYAPESLGNYPDIPSLWQVWDEGTYIKGVGRKPALRVIDQKWGSLKSAETNKGRFPSWRPRNDSNSRKIWANFFFFIHRIEERMKGGHSSHDAVAFFEGLRGQQSLSQLHRSLQNKRKRASVEPEA